MSLRISLLAVLSAALFTLGAGERAHGQLATFGYGNARLGSSPVRVGITPTQAHNLGIAWRTDVGGPINGQPLSVDGVRVRGHREDLVVVGTEAGEVVAVDGHSGRIAWRHSVGHARITPDCQASPNSVFGVTGALAVDRRAGNVYAVDVAGRAWAFALATGRVLPGWPVRIHAPLAGFDWGALAVSRGWLYVPIASLCDMGHVFGGITAVNLAHPSRARRWLTTAGTGSWGGGVWGWGGVSIDDRSGAIFAATGNSQGTTGERMGYAEAVVSLGPDLKVQQANHPLPPGASGDLDFGTTPVLIQRPGCPHQLVVTNKDGELFLYDRNRITAGPVQRIRVANNQLGTIPLYGMPAYDPASRTLVLTSPTTPPHSRLRAGLQAFRLTRGCRLVARWQRRFDPPDAGSAPSIADGVLYIAGGRDGWFQAYQLSNGRQIWRDRLSQQAIFAAPTVDHASVFVGDWSGHITALRER